jgi:DNA-binding XRE family transcriptional regulator
MLETSKQLSFGERIPVSCAQDLGRAIRAIRKQSGLTIEETALSIGIAKQTLNNLEKGRPGISLENTLKIIAGLGISLIAITPLNGRQK